MNEVSIEFCSLSVILRSQRQAAGQNDAGAPRLGRLRFLRREEKRGVRNDNEYLILGFLTMA
jgi:hypothetical protein